MDYILQTLQITLQDAKDLRGEEYLFDAFKRPME